jgi:hypothetical protein
VTLTLSKNKTLKLTEAASARRGRKSGVSATRRRNPAHLLGLR